MAARGAYLLSLPGTIAHELTHLIVSFFLHAKPYGFSMWPRPHGDAWMLGSVSFRNIGLLNGAFVALAPLVLLPIAWLCLIHVLVPLWIEGQWGWWLLAGYLSALLVAAVAGAATLPDVAAREKSPAAKTF